MAFSMDGIIIDRIQMGFAEDFSGNPLYTLTQLSEASISVTAESKEARDANGTLIKTFYTGKSGTFTATNALIDFNILAEGSGSPKQVASTGAKIPMPAIKTFASTTQSATLTGVKEGTVSVIGIAGNGTFVKKFTKDTAAGADKFAITGENLTFPTSVTDNNVAQFVVKYDRDVTSGVKVVNSADKFPDTIKLTLKALAVDPCSADTLRACYIVLPSFQVSPEVEITLSTEGTLNYTGNLQVDYCAADKVLYEIYFAEDDVEE